MYYNGYSATSHKTDTLRDTVETATSHIHALQVHDMIVAVWLYTSVPPRQKARWFYFTPRNIKEPSY